MTFHPRQEWGHLPLDQVASNPAQINQMDKSDGKIIPFNGAVLMAGLDDLEGLFQPG